MKSTFASCMLAAISSAAVVKDGKCHAMVLSGGSNNGAWEVGVMWGLIHYGNPEDYAWDTVSGVSAGAINTGGIATWPTGTEYEMIEWLSDTWANMSTDQVWKVREGSPIDLIFNEPSFFDDDPALQTLKDLVAEKGAINRMFAVSAVDANTGEYIAMTHENTTFDDLAQASLSSGSIPVVFPPQKLNGHVFMDGGTVWNANLATAVEQCKELVDDYSDIVVDIALCSYSSIPTETVSNNAIANWKAARDIHQYYAGTSNLVAEARAYPGLDVRYYFQEANGCPGAGGLSFDNSTTWCLQEAGRADAKAMLDIGNENVSKTLDEWYFSKDLKKEYPHFRDYLNKVYSYVFNK